MKYRVPRAILVESFAHFRECGRGQRECQVLWLSSWENDERITEAVHPIHRSHAAGFDLDGRWLNSFWNSLADRGLGIRVQVHTHPQSAFHSATDDTWPILHVPGFLSLVIPNFGTREIGFADAFLAEIDKRGRFREVPIHGHLEIV